VVGLQSDSNISWHSTLINSFLGLLHNMIDVAAQQKKLLMPLK
jgi:hypothetical protein